MAKPVIVLIESTTASKLRALDHEMPSDTHLVRWKKASWKKKEQVSAVKAFKQVDIFDHFYDQGLEILEITQGYGLVKPRLWSPSK